MTDTDLKDTYSVEVEMRGLDADGKHPVKIVEMSLVFYEDFVSDVKRNPDIKRIGNDLALRNAMLGEIPEDEKGKPEILNLLLEIANIVDELTERAAIIVINKQHPGLLRQVTTKGGNDLTQAVLKNNINEAFGLGGVITALGTITTREPEPETTVEPSPSMTSDSTDSVSTTSSSEPDGAIEKS